MIPSKTDTGCFLIAIDIFSRYIFTEYATDTKTSTLELCMKKVINSLKTKGKRCIRLVLDRQSAFTSNIFQEFLSNQGIGYEYVTPNRHEVWASYVERHIGTLRAMCRASMVEAHLSSKFWRHAIPYTVFVYNRLAHEGLKERTLKTPLENLLGRKIQNVLADIRTFGCICYRLNLSWKDVTSSVQ